jgi:hypothetical protein
MNNINYKRIKNFKNIMMILIKKLNIKIRITHQIIKFKYLSKKIIHKKI